MNIKCDSKLDRENAKTFQYPPTPEVILVGASYLKVQFAILVRIILLPTGVDPLQDMKLTPVEFLLWCRVIGVDTHILPLQSWT